MDQGNLQNLPESPASVTARVITDKGFHILFTVRDMTVSNLLKKLELFQKEALARGWKPDGKTAQSDKELSFTSENFNNPASPITQEVVCSKCGAPAKKKTGYRKDGSLWEGVFCSTKDDSHKVWLR